MSWVLAEQLQICAGRMRARLEDGRGQSCSPPSKAGGITRATGLTSALAFLLGLHSRVLRGHMRV